MYNVQFFIDIKLIMPKLVEIENDFILDSTIYKIDLTGLTSIHTVGQESFSMNLDTIFIITQNQLKIFKELQKLSNNPNSDNNKIEIVGGGQTNKGGKTTRKQKKKKITRKYKIQVNEKKKKTYKRR